VSRNNPLAGIAPPEIQRYVATCIKRTKQIIDQRHPMYGYLELRRRLKSRRSFIANTNVIQEPPTSSDYVNEQKQRAETPVPPDERLPPGENLQWPIWKTINRLKAGVAKTRVNMVKWGYQEGLDTCECGESQSDEFL